MNYIMKSLNPNLSIVPLQGRFLVAHVWIHVVYVMQKNYPHITTCLENQNQYPNTKYIMIITLILIGSPTNSLTSNQILSQTKQTLDVMYKYPKGMPPLMDPKYVPLLNIMHQRTCVNVDIHMTNLMFIVLVDNQK